MATIGSRIREARTRQGLSQADFARALGFSQTAIGEFERDVKIPGGAFFIALKRVFGYSADWALLGELNVLTEGMMVSADALVNDPDLVDRLKRESEKRSVKLIEREHRQMDCEREIAERDARIRDLERERDRLQGQVEAFREVLSTEKPPPGEFRKPKGKS